VKTKTSSQSFSSGDKVRWVGIGRGVRKMHVGYVACKVKAGERPETVANKLPCVKRGDTYYENIGNATEHDTYLLEEDGRLYRPRVSWIKLVRRK